MKKITTLLTLLIVIVLSWCGLIKKDESNVVEWNNSDTVTTTTKVNWKYTFEDENCQSYVNLMECLIDKTPDAAKNQTISSFEKVMELRNGLDKATLPSTCKNTVDMLKNQKEVFIKAGCDF